MYINNNVKALENYNFMIFLKSNEMIFKLHLKRDGLFHLLDGS